MGRRGGSLGYHEVFTKLPSGGEGWSAGALQEAGQASRALLHSAVMFSWD